MQCKSCGSTLADGQRFCPTCGAAAPPPADPACANCGATLEVGARFCPACGRAVDDASDATPEVPAVARCASCGAELAPEARFCRGCGAPVGAATPVQAQPVAAVPQATWAPPPGAFAAPPPATGAGHPVALNIPYPASLSRWKIFFKSFLIIPNVVVPLLCSHRLFDHHIPGLVGDPVHWPVPERAVLVWRGDHAPNDEHRGIHAAAPG